MPIKNKWGVYRKRTAVSIIFLLFHFVVPAQNYPSQNAGIHSDIAAVIISNYSVAQKKLLEMSTVQFIETLTQNNLDKDSVMLMARQITGMPFLLPYSDGFLNKVSGGEKLVNSGQITKAIQLLKNADGEKQIQLLVEIGIWYLHQPGNLKKDLISAGFYIKRASDLSIINKSVKWQNECLFLLGELYLQKQNTLKGKEVFFQLASSGQKERNFEKVARAYQNLGALLPGRDPMKRVYFQRSLKAYKKTLLKEKEIELLGNISGCDATISPNLMENDLTEMISLMKSTGFKHVLYAENQLTVALGRQGKYVGALAHANIALENMKWSGINAAAGSIYIHFGSLYESIGKNDEALLWYKKALNTRKTETHVFWYKSLLFVTSMLMNTHPEESLSILKTITDQFPPKSVWERLQILSIKGECYKELKQPGAADQSYMSFLKLSNQYPLEDSNGELTSAYLLIGNFYISRSNVEKASLFLKKALTNSQKSVDMAAAKYFLLFRIDSLEGNYRSAMQNHIKYKLYNDSLTGIDQRKKLDELSVLYTAKKKDQDIKLLRQRGKVQQAELKQSNLIRNIMIAGTLLLLIIVTLLYSRFQLKKQANKEVSKRNLALKNLVDEKEWLIKEVHHRVKNNLQTIISLLQSQAAYLQDDALKAIETSQNRIYTMSLIHQKLYQSDDIQTIDMAIYIPELIRYLKDSFDNSNKIDFNIKVVQVNLDASIAIPVALIINEALTNSIKYAFPGNVPGSVSVSLQQEGELLKLELSDNGIGMKKKSIQENPVSLGLQLIKGLTKEIHGEVSFRSNHGVKITLLFKRHALEYANLLETDTINLA